MLYWIQVYRKVTQLNIYIYLNSVQFSRSVVSESLWPHELQHTRLPCPSPPLEAFPASGSFPVIWVFASRGQSIGASASVPSSEDSQLISRIDCCDLLAVQGTLSPKASVLQHSAFFMVQLSCPCMTTGKTIALTLWTFVGQVMSRLFNICCLGLS